MFTLKRWFSVKTVLHYLWKILWSENLFTWGRGVYAWCGIRLKYRQINFNINSWDLLIFIYTWKNVHSEKSCFKNFFVCLYIFLTHFVQRTVWSLNIASLVYRYLKCICRLIYKSEYYNLCSLLEDFIYFKKRQQNVLDILYIFQLVISVFNDNNMDS